MDEKKVCSRHPMYTEPCMYCRLDREAWFDMACRRSAEEALMGPYREYIFPAEEVVDRV